MERAHRQFLPGALEILETPPAPLAATMIAVICAFFVAAAAWSWFGQIDIIAVARGKIQPAGRVKTIQSLEAGRVISSSAVNGTHVRQGDILIELDPREAQAERGSIAAMLGSFQAEVLRRNAAIVVARTNALDHGPDLVWPAGLPAPVRFRETRVLEADIAQLSSQLQSLAAQTVQKKAERVRLVGMIAAQKELIATLQERETMYKTLFGQSAGTRSDLLDATESLATQKATLAQETGQIAEIDANLDVIARDGAKAMKTFIADNTQKLGEAERQVADLTEKRARADARLSNLTVKSPIEGVVQSSIVTTPGQVVTMGTELMRIVPSAAGLEIETYLPNQDIAFVRAGQQAVIKIESFPFTRYGTIEATVTRIAHDAIPEPEAAQAEQDPAHPQHNAAQTGADRVQNLVYAVTLKPARTEIGVDGIPVPLSPGMEVTSEIRTGSRRIIDYLLAPLAQVKSQALRER